MHTSIPLLATSKPASSSTSTFNLLMAILVFICGYYVAKMQDPSEPYLRDLEERLGAQIEEIKVNAAPQSEEVKVSDVRAEADSYEETEVGSDLPQEVSPPVEHPLDHLKKRSPQWLVDHMDYLIDEVAEQEVGKRRIWGTNLCTSHSECKAKNDQSTCDASYTDTWCKWQTGGTNQRMPGCCCDNPYARWKQNMRFNNEKYPHCPYNPYLPGSTISYLGVKFIRGVRSALMTLASVTIESLAFQQGWSSFELSIQFSNLKNLQTLTTESCNAHTEGVEGWALIVGKMRKGICKAVARMNDYYLNMLCSTATKVSGLSLTAGWEVLSLPHIAFGYEFTVDDRLESFVYGSGSYTDFPADLKDSDGEAHICAGKSIIASDVTAQDTVNADALQEHPVPLLAAGIGGATEETQAPGA